MIFKLNMYVTEGIVLKRKDIGEADVLFTIYTKDYGKIRALAQGVKKSSAKLKGHLETFSHSEIHFVLGKNGERLVGACLLSFWEAIRKDLAKIAAAQKIVFVVDRYCLSGEKDEEFWNFLLTSFRELEEKISSEATPDFMRRFEERFLAHLGYEGVKELRFLDFYF